MLPTSISTPEESNGFLLWSVARLWQQKRQNSLRELGLSHVEFVLLGHLFWLTTQEQFVTQQRLAEWVHVDKVSVATKVPLLINKGLITKQPHPTDKRAAYLAVTEKGAELAKKGLKAAKQADMEFFEALGNENQELTRLLQILLHEHGEVIL
jgi:DNA-binding MarR family transcriptional regulator